MKRTSERNILIAAFFISATYFVAARAAAIGVNVETFYPIFVHLEIIGGVGFAVLEAFALHRVARSLNVIERDRIEWKILVAMVLVLLIAIPVTATPALVAAQYGSRVTEVLRWLHILDNHLSWIWTFILSSIPSIMVTAIGLSGSVDNKTDERPDEQKITDVILRVGTLDPIVISEETGVSLGKVDTQVRKLQNLFSINGR